MSRVSSEQSVGTHIHTSVTCGGTSHGPALSSLNSLVVASLRPSLAPPSLLAVGIINLHTNVGAIDCVLSHAALVYEES